MGNKLQPHYSDFGGLDTRSNKLIQNPKTFRNGSQNFRYNFQDEVQISNGFQHRDDGSTESAKHGMFEYKYKDINTGQSLTQILGVDNLGNLNKKVANYLKLSNAASTVASYCFYYNGDTGEEKFKLRFLNASGALVTELTVLVTDTLDALKTAINAAAITGITADIVDETGASISSSKLAYLMLNCWDVDLINGSSVTNAVWFWEIILSANLTGVPFPTTALYDANPLDYPEYEGISSVNLNNSIYITDGGFVMKYDGKAVYRAGMPRFSSDLGPVGVTLATYAGGSMVAGTNYKYIFQNGYVDANGAEYLGKIQIANSVPVSLSGGVNSVGLQIYNVGNSFIDENTAFPVFACRIIGDQVLTGSGSQTLTVASGHNISVGMCLRVPLSNKTNGTTTQNGWSFAYYEVTGTTSTTITFNKTQAAHYFPKADPTFIMNLENDYGVLDTFPGGFILNGCFVPDNMVGKTTEPEATILGDKIQCWSPTPLYGAFCRVWRTTSNTENFYKLADLPLSNRNDYAVLDKLQDENLSVSTSELGEQTSIQIDYTAGDELPRACKYLSQWQGQLIQSGRPVIPTRFIGVNYPYFFGAPPTVGPKWGDVYSVAPWMYGENNLCDFQSWYWAKPESPEGFNQSGLYEQSLDTVFNDRITGMSPTKDAFFVFKQRSSAFYTGSLAINQINSEPLDADIGCSSNRSIVEIRRGLLWLDGVNGFYFCVAGAKPVPVGFPISDTQKINELDLNFTKAVAANFRKENLYICAIEDQTFVFDYGETETGSRDCWYLWNRLNTTAILATAADELLLVSDSQLWQMKITNTRFDFTDHTEAIPFETKTAWYNMGKPTVDKSFGGAWINSIQGGFICSVQEYANYLEDQVSSIPTTFPAEGSKKTVKVESKFNTAKVSAISMGIRASVKSQWLRYQGLDIQYAADFDGGEPKR